MQHSPPQKEAKRAYRFSSAAVLSTKETHADHTHLNPEESVPITRDEKKQSARPPVLLMSPSQTVRARSISLPELRKGEKNMQTIIHSIQHLLSQIWPCLERFMPQIMSLVVQFLQSLFISWVMQTWSNRKTRETNLVIVYLVKEVMARNRHQYQLKTL